MSRGGSRRRPRVEVKLGRRGRTLRIDGTFASYYEPGLPLTGSVWDALALPLVLLPPTRRRSVLVLGLGGGSVARVVRALAPAASVGGPRAAQASAALALIRLGIHAGLWLGVALSRLLSDRIAGVDGSSRLLHEPQIVELGMVGENHCDVRSRKSIVGEGDGGESRAVLSDLGHERVVV